MKTVCKQCKGTNVQVKAWVNPNGNVFIDQMESDSDDDTFCDDCQEHTGVEETED